MINETPWVTYKSPWLTVVETALVARCGRRLIYREVKAGRLRAARIGLLRRNLRIHRDWVDAWLEQCAEPVAAAKPSVRKVAN